MARGMAMYTAKGVVGRALKDVLTSCATKNVRFHIYISKLCAYFEPETTGQVMTERQRNRAERQQAPL